LKRVALQLFAVLFIVASGLACETSKSEADKATVGDQEQEGPAEEEATKDEPAARGPMIRTRASEAEVVTKNIAEGVRSYFEGDQFYAPPDGETEGWHSGDNDSDGPRLGRNVSAEDKVFPGGTNIRIVTASEIPEESAKVAFEPTFEQASDLDVEPIVYKWKVRYDEDVYFRYTYETGPGTGPDATTRVIAEANFDPSTPEHHTLVREISVGDDGVVISAPKIEHEFQ
jgi:hypothetical protein